MNYVYKMYLGLTVYYATDRTLTKFSDYVFDAYVFRTKKRTEPFFSIRNFPSKNLIITNDGIVQNMSWGSLPVKNQNINIICAKLEREIGDFLAISKRTITIMIIRPTAGSFIGNVQKQANNLSMLHKLDVQFDFNGHRYLCDYESQTTTCLGKVKDLKQP